MFIFLFAIGFQTGFTLVILPQPPELWDYKLYVLVHLAIFFPTFCKMGRTFCFTLAYRLGNHPCLVPRTFLLLPSGRAGSLRATQYTATVVFLDVWYFEATTDRVLPDQESLYCKKMQDAAIVFHLRKYPGILWDS